MYIYTTEDVPYNSLTLSPRVYCWVYDIAIESVSFVQRVLSIIIISVRSRGVKVGDPRTEICMYMIFFCKHVLY